MDGMLSQEEINALLGNMNTGSSSTQTSNDAILSDEEKDAIGEISNICMGTAATTLYSLVNQKVVITTPVVEITNWISLQQSTQNRVYLSISCIKMVLMEIMY